MVKKRIYAIFALFLALALSACGAKINTELKLDSPTSGQRIMRIAIPKLDEQQAKKINGGIDAVEASIKKHLPEELTFSGFSAEGEKTVGTLTLEFDSLDAYQTKISALSGNSYANLKPGIAINSEGLVTGIQVEENFSSINLLEWAKNGLVEDGVIASADRNNIMEIGDSIVTFGETTYNSTSGRNMYVSEITDNGINHLAVDIAEKESSFDIKVELGYKKGTKYPEEEFKQYLENNRPQDAKVEDLGNDFNGVSVSYSSASLKEAEESLAKLLGDPSFTLKEAENDKENSSFAGNGIPALTRTIDVTFSCSSLCSPQSDDRRLKFTPAENWTIGNSNGEIHQSGKITMYMPLKFSDVSVQSTLGENGGKVVAKVSLNNKTATLAGDAINAFLNPQETGELISKKESENTVYTLTLTGKSQEELNSALAKVSPNTTYSITPSARSGFFKKEVEFTYYNDFGSKFAVTNGKDIQHTVVIDGYSISASNLGNSTTIKVAKNPLSATGVASKFTLEAWILILGIICCVLLSAGILFWKRKELAGKLQARKEKQAALQETPPLQETQGVSPPEVAQTNQVAAEDESICENQIFSENQSIQTDLSLFSTPETHTSSSTQENPAASLSKEDEWSEGDIS